MSEYKMAARNYSMSQIKGVFQLIKEFDGKSKGINNRAINEAALLKELVLKILTVK